MKVMVETSAHHVHVTKETLEALFGKGATLTNKKNLSQPGQFACVEKVTVVGPKSEMKMSILGPERSADQVEISLTDARKLGIAAPVRESGDIAGTPGCKLVGPEGEVEIDFTDTEKPEETLKDTFTLIRKLPRSLVLKTNSSFRLRLAKIQAEQQHSVML